MAFAGGKLVAKAGIIVIIRKPISNILLVSTFSIANQDILSSKLLLALLKEQSVPLKEHVFLWPNYTQHEEKLVLFKIKKSFMSYDRERDVLKKVTCFYEMALYYGAYL